MTNFDVHTVLTLQQGTYTIDTTSGTIKNGENLIATGELTESSLIFSFDSILIEKEANITIIGNLPLELNSTGKTVINGSILSNGNGFKGGQIPAPGDSSNGEGPGGGNYSNLNAAGGGGHGGTGGNGANSGAGETSGAGGLTYGNIILLENGSGGGASGSSPGAGAAGGAGGGAMQINAGGELIIGGLIEANGITGGTSACGGGGGAGGTIFLSGSPVVINGNVNATGGNGGGGAIGGGGGGGGIIKITSSVNFTNFADYLNKIDVSGGNSSGAPGSIGESGHVGTLIFSKK